MTTHVEKSIVRREVRLSPRIALIVTVSPEGLYVRAKRRRTSYLLPLGRAWQAAAALAAEDERRAKAAARQAKRAAR